VKHLLKTVALVLMLMSAGSAESQSVANDSLHNIILMQDKALFDAFNRCDLQAFNQYLAEDIEFYQDNDDVTLTRAQLEPSFKSRCSADNPVKLRRELVANATEVHPMQGYGAVQFGAHQFWVIKDGAADQLASTPKFVHLWRNTGEGWQITRVISYGH
jgi:ketosteroid isomerase-like protein